MLQTRRRSTNSSAVIRFKALACVAAFSMSVVLTASSDANAADSLVILPAKLKLTGPVARHRLLVQTVRGGQIVGQVVKGVTFRSSNPKVVSVEDGFAVAVGNGTATITATAGKQTANVEVTVVGHDIAHQWSFRNHVQSVLSKAGCNSGACHGALAGKNGFKLSLRGYNPLADFRTITRQSRGRRIVPSDPGRSLLLTKPSGAIPHKGGLRFDVDSHDYRVIAEWIASGQPAPTEDDPRLEWLEILPEHAVLKPGVTQQLVVRAHFSDGHVEDVTRWAKYTSTNLTVAQVDGQGGLKVMGNGEGAVVAWYLSRNVIGSVSAPYDTKLPADTFEKAERSSFVDELVLQKLKSLNLPPSLQATDAEFLRRVSLDTIGVLPAVTEVERFLADDSPDKRDRLVDDLLTRPEYVDYWTYKWSDLLLVTGARLRPTALKAYSKWIRERVADNVPWDKFARDIVTAKGSTFKNGAANFFALHQDPLDMAETVSMAFLGMSINCARCHDHPLEKWTNDDYYGMASLFARVRGKGWGGDFRSGDGNRTIFTSTEGELIQPRTGLSQLPRPLDGEAVAFNVAADRRIHFANWLTAPDNPYFSRAIVNRVWANFMGVGIVEKVDDLRLTNPPSNEALLSALAKHFIESKYNLKSLMRLIATSKTYQRSSEVVPGNEADTRFYSRFYPRRLKAEVLLDVISQSTGAPSAFKDYPVGTRALQLPDSSVASSFLNTFGRPERIITCECERSDEPSMVQVLHIVNGDTLNLKLAAKGGIAEKLATRDLPDYKIIELVYLTSLSRYPTNDEMSKILQVFSESKPAEKRAVIEDLFWSTLSSREFLFNH